MILYFRLFPVKTNGKCFQKTDRQTQTDRHEFIGNFRVKLGRGPKKLAQSQNDIIKIMPYCPFGMIPETFISKKSKSRS